jgi:hypothetical protein
MGLVRRPLTYAAGLALVVTSLVVVAGCGQPDVSSTDDGTVSVPIQPTITPYETGAPSPDPSEAVPGGAFDLEAMLTTQSCEQSGGVWSYAGSFANTTDEQLAIGIAISLVSATDLNVLTVHEVDLTVPPNETVPVEAADFYTNQDVDPATVQCLTGVTDKGQ